ncbi:MAG: Peptidase protein [Acidobacteriota bacterium]|nr:Peptidase protein [Acidobacteriota bacterium]
MRKVPVILSVLIWAIFSMSLLMEADSQANITGFRLANGLRVILAPVDNIEAACVMLYHLTGARDDPPDLKGASYLYQTLMLGGTQNLDPLDRIMFIKKYGGSSNGIVDYDNSIFCQLVPDSEVNNAIWLESERISSLRLEDHNIDVLKDNIYKRYSRLNSSNVHFRAMSWIKSLVFEGTVYQTPIYGNLEQLMSFNNQRIKKIYENFNDLSDIIMVVAGKFSVAEVKETINKHFAGLPGQRKNQKRNYQQIEPRKEYIYRNWTEDPVEQSFVICGIRGPAKLNPDHLCFDLIRYYLLDKRISKLERLFNQRTDLDVNLSYEYTDYIEANALVIKITAIRRLDLEKAKYILANLLNSLTTGSISADEVKMVKTLMEIEFKKKLMDLQMWGLLLAESYHLSGSVDLTGTYLNALRKITPFDVTRTAKKYFKKENQVILNVYGQK